MPRDTPAPATALPALSPRSPGSSGSSGSPPAPVLSPRPAFAKPPALDLGAQMQGVQMQSVQMESVEAAQGAAVGQRACAFSSPRFGDATASSPRVLVASDRRVPASVPKLNFVASAPPFAPSGVAPGQTQAVAVAQPTDSILFVPELGGLVPTLVVGRLALLDARAVYEACVRSKYSELTDTDQKNLQALEGRTLRWDIDGRAFVVRDVGMALCGQGNNHVTRWIRNHVKFDDFSSLGEVTTNDVSHVPAHFDMFIDFKISTQILKSNLNFKILYQHPLWVLVQNFRIQFRPRNFGSKFLVTCLARQRDFDTSQILKSNLKFEILYHTSL